MDSLLCDENWLSIPDDQCQQSNHIQGLEKHSDLSNEKVSEALKICLEKESSYVPKAGYARQLQSDNDFLSARFRAVHWLIKSCIRMNLPYGIAFSAVNYLDRFMSVNDLCKMEWNCQMVKLLSVACLSVASKFTEMSVPPFREIQMEGLDHSFETSTIQRMELSLLQELGWHMNSTTPYSYVEIMLPTLDIGSSLTSQLHKDQLTNRVTELLLGALLGMFGVYLFIVIPAILIPTAATYEDNWDTKVLGYIFISFDAYQIFLEEYTPSNSNIHHLNNFTKLFNQDQKDDLVKCHSIMERCEAYHCPSSPVTVLLKEQINIPDDCIFDLTIRKWPCSNMDRNPVNEKNPRI
ncbi:putative cyclin-D7-1 [Tripterygium wilfordii]|uniref:putative cyclin-D7-1 n=1 Tax=Tripterygium wilfordii TaxID=458696 RepID=UPI0018F7E93E|nr:putative cyclin-D7-1 [Tripterygium wilfordii]